MNAASNFRLEILLICLLVSIIGWSIYRKTKPNREKKRTKNFLEKNPKASRLFLQDRGMQVIMINNKAPYAGLKNGEYVAFLPIGENVVDVVYQKSVEQEIEGLKKELDIMDNAKMSFFSQSDKEYRLLYNLKAKKFEIEEQ